MNTASAVEAWKRLRGDLLARFPDIDPETLSDTLEGITGAKDIVARLIRDSLEDAAQAKGLAEYMAALGGRHERIAERGKARKEAAFKMLQEMGETKVSTPEFVAGIQDGKPSVVVTDWALIPPSLTRTTIAPDKAAIKERLEAGETVPGAVLSNAMPYLAVRPR